MEQKLDRILDKIAKIEVVQGVQTQQLKEHMRRSDLLEKRIDQVDREARLALVKFAGFIATLVGIAVALKGLL